LHLRHEPSPLTGAGLAAQPVALGLARKKRGGVGAVKVLAPIQRSPQVNGPDPVSRTVEHAEADALSMPLHGELGHFILALSVATHWRRGLPSQQLPPLSSA